MNTLSRHFVSSSPVDDGSVADSWFDTKTVLASVALVVAAATPPFIADAFRDATHYSSTSHTYTHQPIQVAPPPQPIEDMVAYIP